MSPFFDHRKDDVSTFGPLGIGLSHALAHMHANMTSVIAIDIVETPSALCVSRPSAQAAERAVHRVLARVDSPRVDSPRACARLCRPPPSFPHLRSELIANVPGYKKDELQVIIDSENKAIRLTAHHAAHAEKQDPATKVHRQERSEHYATRVLSLPHNIMLDAITSELVHGVLHVKMPKSKEVDTPQFHRHIHIA